MNEKIKSIGFLTLSFTLLCLAISIAYIAWEANQWRQDLPELLRLTGNTADKITPAITNVSEIGKLVPPILEEVTESRKLVEALLDEVKITREQIPKILKDVKPITQQVENTAKQLPEIIDPVVDEVSKTRETIPGILEEIRKTRETVPEILEEIRKTNITIEKAILEVRLTREAIPGMLNRADQIVLRAQDAGKEAGKGVISGIVGGVISMPANVVGGVRKGAVSLLSPQERENLTVEDINLLWEKLLELVNTGKVGQVATWKNKDSSNSGKITLKEKYQENEKECCIVAIDIYLNKKKPRTKLLKGCRQPDGTWIVTQGSISDK